MNNRYKSMVFQFMQNNEIHAIKEKSYSANVKNINMQVCLINQSHAISFDTERLSDYNSTMIYILYI